jgi:hypothetical protein
MNLIILPNNISKALKSLQYLLAKVKVFSGNFKFNNVEIYDSSTIALSWPNLDQKSNFLGRNHCSEFVHNVLNFFVLF